VGRPLGQGELLSSPASAGNPGKRQLLYTGYASPETALGALSHEIARGAPGSGGPFDVYLVGGGTADYISSFAVTLPCSRSRSDPK
jgi:hypothetical protein